MRKHSFVNDCYYHVYNRGVDKREIFLDERDYLHFVHNLYEFNDKNLTVDPRFTMQRTSQSQSRTPVVDIVCWCLMPNHYHILLRQRVERGVTLFMKKLGIGYAEYFNKKYERTGTLFQGRFKSVFVDRDSYLLHLIRYVHLNPVELIETEWKEKGISNWERVNKFLELYRWSSYPDWIGQKNFPSLLAPTVATEMFSGSDDHKRFVQAWLAKDREEIVPLSLE